MAGVTIGLGALLVLLGIGAYLGTGSQSVTAMIPAFFGVPIAILGVAARSERWLKAAMHGAVLVALLGLFGSARGIPGVITLATGGEVARPAATVVQATMAVLCGVFLVLAIRSFVEARRARSG